MKRHTRGLGSGVKEYIPVELPEGIVAPKITDFTDLEERRRELMDKATKLQQEINDREKFKNKQEEIIHQEKNAGEVSEKPSPKQEVDGEKKAS